jgi:pantothenate synthetase
VSLVRLAKRHASRVEDGPLRILVAAKLGAMRLIDNIAV